MRYTWILEKEFGTRWQLIKVEDNIIVCTNFYFPTNMNDQFVVALAQRNGILEKVDRDLYKILFNNEDDARLMVEEFIEPMTIMSRLKENE